MVSFRLQALCWLSASHGTQAHSWPLPRLTSAVACPAATACPHVLHSLPASSLDITCCSTALCLCTFCSFYLECPTPCDLLLPPPLRPLHRFSPHWLPSLDCFCGLVTLLEPHLLLYHNYLFIHLPPFKSLWASCKQLCLSMPNVHHSVWHVAGHTARLHFLASFAGRYSHVTEFWPMEYEQGWCVPPPGNP